MQISSCAILGGEQYAIQKKSVSQDVYSYCLLRIAVLCLMKDIISDVDGIHSAMKNISY